jgi:imidazolonepropionase-like amidohydrolase
MGDHFGIALGSELVARSGKLLAQRGEVVDLSVEGYPDRAILVGDGRIAGEQVDDGQPCLADGGSAMSVDPGGVGTSVAQVAKLQLDRLGR